MSTNVSAGADQLGEGRSQAADAVDAAAGRAASGRCRLRPRRDVPRNRARPRRSRASASRQAAADASPQPHRISERGPRSARPRVAAAEVSIDYLLPPDNISSGFDNIADLLFVSPSNMERYLDAARKISRLAVGDPAMPVMVNIHQLDPEHPQDERVDELPFGTRGGIAVRSEFPVDGTYIVKVDVRRRAGPRPGDHG